MKNDGVSPIIGTIMLVGLTVMFVGIVGVVLMGGFGMAEPAPILGVVIGQEGNIITISHMKGEVLPKGSFKILVDGVDRTVDFGATGDFNPGMILSWNSGTEKVGTVSVVYTGETGASMILADKKIGKAFVGFEDRYTIIEGKKKQWATFLNEVNASSNGVRLVVGSVYVDNGDYWVSNKNSKVTKPEAAVNPTIEGYMASYTDYRLIKINLSNKTFTKNDMDPTNFNVKWKSMPYPTRGDIYEYGGGVYMCKVAGGTDSKPVRKPTTTSNWVKIATIK